MHNVVEIATVLSALQYPRYSLRADLSTLPPKLGLYAIYGDEQAWTELRLGMSAVDVALYVGKAEDSVVKRDLETHFDDGRTGSSTGVPRNTENPGYFSNYGLSPYDDAKLTRWMRDRLELAVWTSDGTRQLGAVEVDVLHMWQPPINIQHVDHRWKSFLKEERKVLTDQAKAWRPPAWEMS